MRLTLGFSPCPNDTYIFHALVAGLVEGRADAEPVEVGSNDQPVNGRGGEPFSFDVRLADIDELNAAAARGDLDVAKVSYHAYGHIADDYVLLRAGGAIGHGVGPLLVARDADLDLSGKRVAIPGGRTTANLLLALLRDDLEPIIMRYDRIMPAVAAGEVDAGLIIHESRFTYRQHGLQSLVDLGAWWQDQTGLPVPLGAIAAKRSLGSRVHAGLNAAIGASLRFANERPSASARYVAEHAQEMSADVRRQHIELYVNDHSVDVGPLGEAAVRELLRRATERDLFPPVREPLFADPEAGIKDPGVAAGPGYS